jgi:hypothetical protein
MWDVPTWEENVDDVEIVVLNFVVTADRSVNVVGHVSRLAAVFRVMTSICIDKLPRVSWCVSMEHGRQSE